MTIVGCYGRTIYRDLKNGNSIFTFTTKDMRPCNVTCLGVCQAYPSGMPLKIDGVIKNGEFYFTKCTPYVNTRDKLISFLSGATFNGIGPRTAEKIYDFVKGNIFEYVMDPFAEEELADAFSSDIAKEVVTKIKAFGKVNKLYEIIVEFGGTMSSALKISEVTDVEDFLDNIYEIGIAGGLSFGCCDGVAKSVGYSPYDKRRVNALFAEALKMVTSSGNTYANIKRIEKIANKICMSSAFTEKIPATLLLTSSFYDRKYKIKEDEGEVKYYPSYLYNAENSVANGILRLQQNTMAFPFNEKIVEEIEKECGIRYSESQKKSFSLLKSSGVKILTGGPGTGKSTTVNGIIKAIKKMFPGEQPLLCAPTGRAAQRLSEVTGEESSTIHRALNIMPYGDSFISTSAIESRFIIVDEASMLDITLLDKLISAIDSSAFVLFCGDVEQLPSIGSGNVLNDMISSGKIEVVTLDVVYRCLEDSLVSYNANLIRKGKKEVKIGKDFHFFSLKTESEMKAKIKEIVGQNYKESNPFDMQVLTTVKDGELGTKTLNKELQKICNKSVSVSTNYDGYKYMISDKIIMTKNNYENGYFNGDIGTIIDIDEKSVTVFLGDDKEVVLKRDNLDDLAPAYALTVHKSQGSEFSSVVVVLPEKPINMLQKNLLYTAITRAKKEVFVIAQNNAYDIAIKNTKITERKTTLRKKILKGEYLYG